MANRRFGGGGGGGGPSQKLGGFQQHNFQGNKVNPWQGGNAPGIGTLNSGLLSQLSGSQAQIALALTTLLQSQQPVNNNPPSLLSLPTNLAFANRDNFNSQNRFHNRDRDFRRHDSYKNNRSGNVAWRDISTKPTGGGNSSGGNRSSSGNKGRLNTNNRDRRSPIKTKSINRNDGGGNKNQASSIKPSNKSTFVPNANKSVGDHSSNKPKPLSQVHEEPIHITDDIKDEETVEEKKREWRQEKNADAMEEDENAEEESEKPMDMNEDTGNATEDNQKEPKKLREGKYQGVNANFLHCFVCNKSMWDGESFQNHIRGKAHKQMMDSLGHSFQITVNILRENMRLVEEKKMIEVERIHRNSRNFHRQMDPQSHCNMCDLKFHGKIITHRKTEGHQRLKRFLHPKCTYCVQEFPSRMEWIDHRFTPDHLRKIQQVLENRTGDEGSFDGAPVEETADLDNDPLLEESLQTENEQPVLELDDDMKDLQNRIPAYKPSRAVGTKNMQPMNGFYCDICTRFMTTETAATDHLKTERHYNLFVQSIKRQYKRMMNEKSEAEGKHTSANDSTDEPSCKKQKMEEDEEVVATDAGKEYASYSLDEEMAEVDALIQSEQNEESETENVQKPEEQLEAKEECKVPESVPTFSARGRRGNVRNGAGPKSRTKRGGR